MENLWLAPPVVFIIVLIISWLLSYLSSKLAYRHQGKTGALTKAYASGEEVKTHRVNPDYSQFFPFAFFFTLLHVVTLIIATGPTRSWGSFLIAMIYILGALLGLLVLFRR